jgi:hypothetical protein
VHEKKGKRDRYTLTGVHKRLTLFPVDDNHWPEAGGWYAQLQYPGYEVVESMLLPGEDVGPQLAVALGKEAAKKVEHFHRFNSLVGNFEWTARKIKPGDKVYVYIPSIVGTKTYLKNIQVRVNGKPVWSPTNANEPGKFIISERIIIPEPAEKNVALLSIRVGSSRAHIPEGVRNIYILRKKAKK